MRDFERMVKENVIRFEKKAWGEVAHIFASDEVAVSILKLEAGFRCSRHLHTHRVNKFIILSGSVEIDEWCNEEDCRKYPDRPAWRHILIPGVSEQISIRINIPHMFRVWRPGLMVEIYTANGGPVRADDITRFDEGGPCV